jgi:acetyl esterase/lipase
MGRKHEVEMMNLIRRVIFLLTLVMWTASAQAQVRVDRNVVYGMYSGLALLLDVHYPDRPNGYGIVCVPGSAFTAPLAYDAEPLKESAEMDDWTRTFLASGYTLFFVNHRATPRFTYPAAVDDIQRAIRFVRANAATFKIVPTQVGGFGGSSGGYLVGMLGVLDGKGDPDDHDPVNRVSSKLQSVVALYTNFDLKRMEGNTAVTLFVGVHINPTLPESALRAEYGRYAEASSVNYVTPDDPPFLLIHGDADRSVPFEQSQLMEAALKKVGVPVKLVTVSGGGHGRNFGLPDTDVRLPTYFAEAAQWFDKYLRKAN